MTLKHIGLPVVVLDGDLCHSTGCPIALDFAGDEDAMSDVEMAVNYHDRLASIVQRLVDDHSHYLSGESNHDCIEDIISDSRSILTELSAHNGGEG